MVDYKKILQLSSEGNSLRQVAVRVGNSHHTVKDVLDAASEHNISWSLDDEITNEELDLLLYPERKSSVVSYTEPDYAYIHRELSKNGLTLEKYSVQPVVNPDHMPENHRKYMRYNAEEFRRWAADVGKSTENIVKYFLELGNAPEQGYKSCVSLVKLGERYGKRKLESACERMSSLSSAPSIRTITTILKNSRQSAENTDTKSAAEYSCNKYGITRGASYFRKGGADNE